MKKIFILCLLMCSLVWQHTAFASFVSGSTGSDGAFTPTANIQVTLPPSGVLNYTTVNIPTGVTVTFIKNAANTPVYMLATGDISIAGTISVNGADATAGTPGCGGPGGYGGGAGGGAAMAGGSGQGPGGGTVSQTYTTGGGGGLGTNGTRGYGTNGAAGGGVYGSPALMPIVGGSGGSGGAGTGTSLGYPGGGGGGAIVIASSTGITITGSIVANGGKSLGYYYTAPNPGGGGSGGAIRLVTNIISGNGAISAAGGAGDATPYAGFGGAGRIRLEANSNTLTSTTNPPYTFGSPTTVFPANIPTLTITSVGGYTPPTAPTGSYGQPDITLPSGTSNPVVVSVSAMNIPVTTTVAINVTPQYYDGTVSNGSAILSGTNGSSSGSASVSISTTYSNVISAQATFTVVGMQYNGEEIEKVRVAATWGQQSEAVYITKSGKEISRELMAASK